MPKKPTNEGFAKTGSRRATRGLEMTLVEVYRGVSGLIAALRAEIHRRFDRLEKFILTDHGRRIERLERKVGGPKRR
jgi:hypothetical protein